MEEVMSMSDLELFIKKQMKSMIDTGHYDIDYDDDSTIADILLKHLVSKPGVIKNIKTREMPKEELNTYHKALNSMVLKGQPVQVFFYAFSPKFQSTERTNGLVFPDASDVLALLHMSLIAKSIRELYSYGFQYIIAYKGTVYKSIGLWDDETIDKTYKQLLYMKDKVEKVTDIKNAVKIIDANDIYEEYGDSFKKRLDNEMEVTKEAYKKDGKLKKKLDNWQTKYKTTLNPAFFKSEVTLTKHAHDQAIFYEAFESVKLGGKKNIGLTNKFPNVILASFRGIGHKMSLQFHPEFRYHSHQRLACYSEEKANWKLLQWKDFSTNAYQPVYISDFDHPFYFDV